MVKKTITKSIVRWCAQSIRLFKIVADNGFRELAQEFINIGALRGNVPAMNFIPDRTTVSRNIDSEYKEILARILPEIQDAMMKGIFYLLSFKRAMLRLIFF